MSLLQAEPSLILWQLCNTVNLFNNRYIESDSQRKNLDPSHLPQVASLLFIIHTNHHSEGVLIQGNQSSPSVEEAANDFY
jgi:hypothetical protein